MMALPGRDERTAAVENASYRWGLSTVLCGLLLDLAYRGLIKFGVVGDYLSLVASNWDLMALAAIGGMCCGPSWRPSGASWQRWSAWS